MSNWNYRYTRCFGWVPIQPCRTCGKWYWGGFPGCWRWDRGDWLPHAMWWACYKEYCSKRCYLDGEVI